MKRNVFVYLIIIVLLGTGLFIGSTKSNKKSANTNKMELSNNGNNDKTSDNNDVTVIDKMKKIDFYKDENKKRYASYYESFSNLSLEDIVTRVNLNLDKDPYDVTFVSPYHNKDYILVNKHIYMRDGYVPDNLESLDTSYARSGMRLVKSAKNALVKMVDSAKSDGFTIRVMSSYRSYEYQVDLYNRYKEKDGEKEADTYSARAGFSEHQTGLCIDIDDGNISYTNFEKSPSFGWMQENAHKYGFILRYPKDKVDITTYTYESWHYRYVGEEIATYIKTHNISFDEYYVQFIENKK